MPNARGGAPELRQRLSELRELERNAGRDRIPVTVWSPRRDARLIADLEELGVDRCVFGLTAAPAEQALPRHRALCGDSGPFM